jgi:general secretion pathway protein M
MRQYWDNLQPRERIILLFGAGCVLLLLLYAFVWEPLSKERTRLEQSVAEQRALLAWIGDASQEVERLRGGRIAKEGRTGESLMALVDRTAKSGGLGTHLKRLQPDGSDKVRLWLEASPFDSLVRWLKQLEEKYGVYSEGVVIDSTDNQGLVNARLVLESRG